MSLAAAGCGPKTAASVAAPIPVFVRIDDLAAAHPLQSTVRDIDSASARLRQDALSAARLAPSVALPLPTGAESAAAPSSADRIRDRAARARLFSSARTSLQEYAAALETIRLQFATSHRFELLATARANSVARENAVRQKIQDDTRSSLFDLKDASGKVTEPYGRAFVSMNTSVKTNAAKQNLNPGNVVSVARSATAPYAPDPKVLEAQVAALNALPSPPPKVTADGKPLRFSDEARLTKTLNDLQVQLKRIADTDKQIESDQMAAIDAAIARIRAENDASVAEQLANSPWQSRQSAEKSQFEAQLNALGALLNSIEASSTTNGPAVAPGASAPDASPMIVIAAPAGGVLASSAVARLQTQRESLRQTIYRDTVSAVRDAAAAHGMEAVFTRSLNGRTLADHTEDFRRWIFPTVGNVGESPLSNEAKLREREGTIPGTNPGTNSLTGR